MSLVVLCQTEVNIPIVNVAVLPLQPLSQSQVMLWSFLIDLSLFLLSALVITALFDRNVNCRKAASVSAEMSLVRGSAHIYI